MDISNHIAIIFGAIGVIGSLGAGVGWLINLVFKTRAELKADIERLSSKTDTKFNAVSIESKDKIETYYKDLEGVVTQMQQYMLKQAPEIYPRESAEKLNENLMNIISSLRVSMETVIGRLEQKFESKIDSLDHKINDLTRQVYTNNRGDK